MRDPGLRSFPGWFFVASFEAGHKGGRMSETKSPAASADSRRPETRLIHSGVLRSHFNETAEALFLTQGFLYDTAEQCEARFKGEDPGFIYSRFSNPNISMFEQRMCALEGAEAARATATGMWRAATRPNTRTCFLESPTNPTLDVLDIAAIAEIAHHAGARLIVDNVFATPIWQSPLQLGADVVVYSATKHIDGQGRCLGGIILSSNDFIQEHIHNYMRQTGPSISPFNAWTLVKGLETLAIRVRQQTQSAAAVAEVLALHPKISRVVYPGRADHPQAALVKKQMRGGSTLIGFEVKGGKAAAFRFLNALKLARISNNLGDARSLVTHPATTTHQRLAPEARAELGISEGFVRFSTGLEHADDLIEDVHAALERA